jgi:type II secretory pathway pseudopilin PulG
MYPLENVTMEQEKMAKQPCISGNGQSGYNLLQMAMSILILGILAASFIQVYNNYNQDKIRRTSYENLQLAMNTIHSFRVSNGAIPCPAPMSDGRATATYGAPVNCNAGAIAALLPGQCANGVCIEESPAQPFQMELL